jgi:hypothetical protein
MRLVRHISQLKRVCFRHRLAARPVDRHWYSAWSSSAHFHPVCPSARVLKRHWYGAWSSSAHFHHIYPSARGLNRRWWIG